MDMQKLTLFCTEEDKVIATIHEILPHTWQKGMEIRLNSGTYRVDEWYYYHDEVKQQSGLKIMVAEKRKPKLNLSEEARDKLGMFLACITVILAIFVAAWFWLFPIHAKASLGYIIRPFVGFGTWFGLVVLGLYIEERIIGPTLLGTYVRWLLGFGGMLLGFVLAVAIVPQAPLQIWPDDYARYFDEVILTYKSGWLLISGTVGTILAAAALVMKLIKYLNEVKGHFRP